MFNTIADLKQFSVQIKNTSNIDDLSVIIYRLKAYIQQNDELQNIVKDKIDECKILKETLKYRLLARYLCGELREVITPKILKIERFMYLDWWENINNDNPNGLRNLYLIPKPTKIHYEKFKQCKIITSFQCYPLFTFFHTFLLKHDNCINIYMFCNAIENNSTYSSLNAKFYLLYLKAITNGTLNYLIEAINPNCYEYKKLKCVSEIQLKPSNKNKSQGKQKELYVLLDCIKQHPEFSSPKQFADELKKSESTIKTQLREICQKIYEVQDGEKGLQRVKELIYTKT